MEKIWELSQRYGFFVIEDASHAIGGRYKKQYIGSCSFHYCIQLSLMKIITTAEMELAVTVIPALLKRLSLQKSQDHTQ